MCARLRKISSKAKMRDNASVQAFWALCAVVFIAQHYNLCKPKSHNIGFLGCMNSSLALTARTWIHNYLNYLSLLINSGDEDERDGDSGGVPHDETNDQEQLRADDLEVEQEERAQDGRGRAEYEAERAHGDDPRPRVAAVRFVVVAADEYQRDCPLGLGCSTFRCIGYENIINY